MKAPSPFFVYSFRDSTLPEHSSITDPNIHEPKGVATATSGQVYKANGSGSGSWQDVLPSQTGNSGKFLTTNGSTASWTASTSAGGSILARGSINGTSVTGSYNIASASGSSQVTVTFSTPLSSSNYTAMVTVTSPGATTDKVVGYVIKSTTDVVIYFYRGSTGAAAAPGSFDIVIFG